ncbi:Uncharacterised protein [Dermatophilus congolensis]|uniref:Uncharacterized protein n=1 Tax=Dermatophilus congolensis TaxID=1863 RepID=A0AA46BQ03_9MICO|nr:Uncharacterised protein [Dermatophilus congolensis]
MVLAKSPAGDPMRFGTFWPDLDSLGFCLVQACTDRFGAGFVRVERLLALAATFVRLVALVVVGLTIAVISGGYLCL